MVFENASTNLNTLLYDLGLSQTNVKFHVKFRLIFIHAISIAPLQVHYYSQQSIDTVSELTR